MIVIFVYFIHYKTFISCIFRSKGKDSEYENVDSDQEPTIPDGASKIPILKNRTESEQREIDDFEKEERRILSEESQVNNVK